MHLTEESCQAHPSESDLKIVQVPYGKKIKSKSMACLTL